MKIWRARQSMIDQFLELVRRYLALADEVQQSRARAFLCECAILLPQIYAIGQQLPDVELPDSDQSDGVENFQSPITTIHQKLGKYDLYWEVFDPVFDTKPVVGLLSDDLTDIYRELKEPLAKYETDVEGQQRTAIWEWKFNIAGHCGDHLVDVLRPIHRLVYNHMPADES